MKSLTVQQTRCVSEEHSFENSSQHSELQVKLAQECCHCSSSLLEKAQGSARTGEHPPDCCSIPTSQVIVKNTITFVILHLVLDTVNAETLKANLNTKQHFTVCTIKLVSPFIPRISITTKSQNYNTVFRIRIKF